MFSGRISSQKQTASESFKKCNRNSDELNFGYQNELGFNLVRLYLCALSCYVSNAIAFQANVNHKIKFLPYLILKVFMTWLSSFCNCQLTQPNISLSEFRLDFLKDSDALCFSDLKSDQRTLKIPTAPSTFRLEKPGNIEIPTGIVGIPVGFLEGFWCHLVFPTENLTRELRNTLSALYFSIGKIRQHRNSSRNSDKFKLETRFKIYF